MQLLPNGKQTFFDGAGNPLANGKVYFYLPNTSTPATTYQDASGQTPNANPVILDGNGQAIIYGTGSYRQVVQDASSVTVWDQTTTAPDAGFIDLGNTTNGKGADLVANAAKKVASIAALRALRVPQGSDAQTVIVDGQAEPFVWNATSTAVADGGITFLPNSLTSAQAGRWVREFSGPVNALWFAAGDGVADDTAAVTNALASNRQTYLPEGKTFLVTGLSPTGLSNFSVFGGGKLKLANAANKPVIQFNNCQQFKVDIIEVDGNGANQNVTTNRNDGACIVVNNCQNFKILGNHVHDNFSGAAILAVDDGSAGSAPGNDTNGLIAFNRVANAGYGTGNFQSDGIFANSDNTLVAHNWIKGCSDYGIAGDYSYKLNIFGNKIYNVQVGIGILGAYNWDVANNTIDTAHQGIAVTLSGNPAQAPYLTNGAKIHGNTVLNITQGTGGTPNGDGIFVDPSATDISITNNTVRNVFRGIANSSPKCVLTGNTVDTTTDRGIYCDGAGSIVGPNKTINCAGGNYYGTTIADKTLIEEFATTAVTTFQGSWSNYGGGTAGAAYYRQGNRVYLTGVIKGGTTSLGQPIFNLPAGFRPATEVVFVCSEAYTGTNILTVSSAGDLTYASGAGTRVCLDGISFPVA